jgi:hypothetical protein
MKLKPYMLLPLDRPAAAAARNLVYHIMPDSERDRGGAHRSNGTMRSISNANGRRAAPVPSVDRDRLACGSQDDRRAARHACGMPAPMAQRDAQQSRRTRFLTSLNTSGSG